MDEMTDEEIAAEIERLRKLLARRQVRSAIERDLSERVDEIAEANPDVMTEAFSTGRLTVDDTGDVTIRPADQETV
ncbi:hypothetical protein [Brevibacterium gallinarum]|uniref:Uncharacterized protein n=1 Tax=Brevibacterium gallinarum TaxID=2762220 RepID=A0ABR8WR40_9MICO|nr:hypothetical protein [Brevibacterium gallinarum]MBD8019402.1 hypothetical protein [Brevibacterium gallinarum]